MLSTREMDPASLAQVARTWQNTHLVYTHGQGGVVSPANTVTPQGLPELLERDIPATTNEHALAIDVPQVYFGLRPADYAVVGTRLDEVARPSDNAIAEIRTRYSGGGGLARGSGPRRQGLGPANSGGKPVLSGDGSAQSPLLLPHPMQ